MREKILSVPIHVLGNDRALAHIVECIRASLRPASFIVQLNVNSIVAALNNSRYQETVQAASLCVPDGMPLVWILRWRGYQNAKRVYGPDLMLMVCERAAKEGWRSYFYGGKPGVPELLKETLVARFPGLNVVGTFSPPFRELTPEEDAEVCRMISATKPDILWVGLGSPKQDIWMYEHREKLDVALMHGVGAAFDFLTGQVRQAPRWMMNAGLEWLYRLMQEPRRLWKRYTIVNAKFLWYLIIDVMRKKK